MIVNHPVLGKVEVPDEVAIKDIDKYLLEEYKESSETTSALDAFANQFYQGVTSSARGIGQFFGVEDEDAYVKEFESRLELEKFGKSGMAGLFAGSILDPITLPAAVLKPIKAGASVVGTMAGRGAAAGAFGGAVEPVYEEFGDSRLFNTGVGSVLGLGLGAGGGAILKKLGKGVDDLDAPVQRDAEPAVVEEIDTPSQPLAPSQPDLEAQRVAANRARIEASERRRVEARQAEEDALDVVSNKESERLSIEELKRPLLEQQQRILPNREAEALVSTVEDLTRRLENAKKAEAAASAKAAGGTKRSRAKLSGVIKDLSDRTKKLQQSLDSYKGRLAEHNKGLEAKKNLARIGAGKLNADEKAIVKADLEAVKAQRLEAKRTAERLKQEAAQPAPRKADVPADAEAPKKKIATTVEEQAAQKADEALEAKPAPTGVPKVDAALQAVSNADAPVPFVRTGLSPRGTSVGAAEVSPAAKFADTTSEGINPAELAAAASSRQKVSEEEIPSFTDRGESMAQVFKKTKAYMASQQQLAKIAKVDTYEGSYSFEQIEERAKRLQAEIGETYDSLMEYLIDRVKSGRGQLDAVEKELLAPLFEEAAAKVLQSMSTIRSLKRAGKIDSEETVTALQEFQLYNYISNVELNDKAATSAALRQYKKMKAVTKRQTARVKGKKPVGDIFGGVKCV